MPTIRARMPLEISRNGQTYSGLAVSIGVNVGDLWNLLHGRREKVGKARRVTIMQRLEAAGVLKPRARRTRIKVGHSGCAK